MPVAKLSQVRISLEESLQQLGVGQALSEKIVSSTSAHTGMHPKMRYVCEQYSVHEMIHNKQKIAAKNYSAQWYEPENPNAVVQSETTERGPDESEFRSTASVANSW